MVTAKYLDSIGATSVDADGLPKAVTEALPKRLRAAK